MRHHTAALTIALVAVAAVSFAADEPERNGRQTRVLAEIEKKVAAAEKAEALAVAGADGWLFLRPELRHLSVGPFWGDAAAKVARSAKPKFADPLPAIVGFHKELAEQGVELIFVPVPPKAAVYPDKIATDAAGGELPRIDPHLQGFYKVLEAKGVRVLDLTERFRKARGHEKGPVYCKTDSHWSPLACVLAAEAIAKAVGEPPWLEKAAASRPMRTEWKEITFKGDLVELLPEDAEGPKKETLPGRFVGTGADLETVEPDESSPVVLMGDSHTLVFHAGGDLHATGAGLADQLAAELGLAVDLIGTRGSGATPVRMTFLRRVLRRKGYLEAKKVVVWCLSARELTEAFQGWQPLPVKP